MLTLFFIDPACIHTYGPHLQRHALCGGRLTHARDSLEQDQLHEPLRAWRWLPGSTPRANPDDVLMKNRRLIAQTSSVANARGFLRLAEPLLKGMVLASVSQSRQDWRLLE